jgi:hypothetical protein
MDEPLSRNYVIEIAHGALFRIGGPACSY